MQSDSHGEQKRKWTEAQVDLENQLEDLSRALEDEKHKRAAETAKSSDTERVLREELEKMADRLSSGMVVAHSGGKNDKVNSASLQDLKTTIDAAMAELKSAETEKRQLELKAEHERQLIGLERTSSLTLTHSIKILKSIQPFSLTVIFMCSNLQASSKDSSQRL